MNYFHWFNRHCSRITSPVHSTPHHASRDPLLQYWSQAFDARNNQWAIYKYLWVQLQHELDYCTISWNQDSNSITESSNAARIDQRSSVISRFESSEYLLSSNTKPHRQLRASWNRLLEQNFQEDTLSHSTSTSYAMVGVSIATICSSFTQPPTATVTNRVKVTLIRNTSQGSSMSL